ncbi:hypothetical protein [Pseudoneobacillus rhizosphaerae]|uniref:Gfo/Idh/MocA family oxidoreductase n=1 Tax=Pseudoneobacillus rhizosphaerae TaxID=2880968 RepID=A0A9C7GDK0_9BACI|nr:hypothetical protein [Pseudoneobacillus rhizosphaerae]CAG9610436.1 hypothetical protein NEOCIP111885_04210 [Pseudoneobacillus rhizosphaerae]
MKIVRIGIHGLGVQGSYYADLIPEGKVNNLKLGAICTSNSEKEAI